MLRSIGRALLVAVIACALRVLRWTWRVEHVGAPPARGGLFAFWHGDQLALTALGHRPAVLISRSADGELAARVARSLGFAVIRGSSSRGAVAAALALVRRLRMGSSVALAVDGPRGPRHVAAPGAARLAARTRAALITVAACPRRGLWLRSWDRMVIPAPFTTVYVVWGRARCAPLSSSLGSVSMRARRLAGQHA